MAEIAEAVEPTPGFEPGTFSFTKWSSIPGEFEAILALYEFFGPDRLPNSSALGQWTLSGGSRT